MVMSKVISMAKVRPKQTQTVLTVVKLIFFVGFDKIKVLSQPRGLTATPGAWPFTRRPNQSVYQVLRIEIKS